MECVQLLIYGTARTYNLFILGKRDGYFLFLMPAYIERHTLRTRSY